MRKGGIVARCETLEGSIRRHHKERLRLMSRRNARSAVWWWRMVEGVGWFFLGGLADTSLKTQSSPPIARRLPHPPLIPYLPLIPYRRMSPYCQVYPCCQFHVLIPFRCRQEPPGCFHSTRAIYRILPLLNSHLAGVSTCWGFLAPSIPTILALGPWFPFHRRFSGLLTRSPCRLERSPRLAEPVLSRLCLAGFHQSSPYMRTCA